MSGSHYALFVFGMFMFCIIGGIILAKLNNLMKINEVFEFVSIYSVALSIGIIYACRKSVLIGGEFIFLAFIVCSFFIIFGGFILGGLFYIKFNSCGNQRRKS